MPPTCLYINGRRVHHFLIGVAVVAAGAAIAWHDRRDWRCALPDLLRT